MEQEPILIDFTGLKVDANSSHTEVLIAKNLAFYQSRGECLDNRMTSKQAMRGMTNNDHQVIDIISRMPKWKQFICLKCPPLFKILFPFAFAI